MGHVNRPKCGHVLSCSAASRRSVRYLAAITLAAFILGLFPGHLLADAEREKLIKKLADDPKDTRTREKLILIYVMERDDLPKAASLLATGVDEKLRECVLLAAKKPADLTGAACMQLGDWYYRDLLEKAPQARKAAVLAKARMYYKQYLGLPTKRDMGRYKVSTALLEVNKELKKLGSAAPSRKSLTLDLGNGVTMKLIRIPAGSFMMGSPKSQKAPQADEGPQHKVTISPGAPGFYMGVYEVTQEQYEAVVGKNPAESKGAKKPVETVSWDDAVAFCNALSKKAGRTVRLPTEAEWEYACRAGTKTKFSFGDDEKQLGDCAWYQGNSGSKTNPVGQKKPNAWGLYDMHGNVWEWCSDWYVDSYANAKAVNPQGAPSGSIRVLRGGSWNSDPGYCRSARRGRGTPGYRYGFIGFRVRIGADLSRTSPTQPAVKPSKDGGGQIPQEWLVSMEDIYRIRLAEFKVGGPGRRDTSAAVSFRNNVVERFITMMQGESEKFDARKFKRMSPYNKLKTILNETEEVSIHKDIWLKTDPWVMKDFRGLIWRLVALKCGSLTCHGAPKGQGKFKLLRAGAISNRIDYSNFLILSQYSKGRGRMLDRDNVNESLLLHYGLPTDDEKVKYRHPGKKKLNPAPFASVMDGNYGIIQKWIGSLRGPPYGGNYKVKYQAPFGPTPQAGLKLDLGGSTTRPAGN